MKLNGIFTNLISIIILIELNLTTSDLGLYIKQAV